MQDNGPDRPEYLDEFPTEKSAPKYQLIRTPTIKRVWFLIASNKPLLCGVHHIRKRTVPCTKPRCDGCDDNVEVRYKAFVQVFTPANLTSHVLEITDHGAQPLLDHYRKNGSLRGCKLEVWRSGKKDNSPVCSRVSTQAATWGDLPDAIDLREYMERIWYSRKANPNRDHLLEDGQAVMRVEFERTRQIFDDVAKSVAPLNGRKKK